MLRRLLSLGLLLLAAGGAHARTWHVPADALTIQAGIDSAAVGDVVDIAAGTYHETAVELKRGLTIRGSGGAVSASNVDHVRFERCLFMRNYSGHWGAVIAASYTGDPGVEFDQCTITGNQGAGYWSAVFAVGYGVIDVTRCIVAGNEVQFATNGPSHLGFVRWTCNDLFDNQGDDYTQPSWTFDDGNFSADPCFCDPAGDDFSLAADSWCLPGQHPWGCDDLVGAFGEGCPPADCVGPVAIEPHSWSSVRYLFR